jgi:hypothetical protein
MTLESAMLRILVAGTLRCGTAYTAQVLNLIGIPCGHGWVYSPQNVRRYPEIELLGDASPLAAPFVRDFNGLVLHQVRNPLKVIGSLLSSTLFQHPRASGSEGESLALHFAFTGDLLSDAMRYYTDWNTRCERHNNYLRYRIEDLDAGLLGRIAGLIGHEVEDRTIRRALEMVPTDANTHYHARSVKWSDLPDGPAKDALTRLAARYSYPTTDH